jgi:hypothetical protein
MRRSLPLRTACIGLSAALFFSLSVLAAGQEPPIYEGTLRIPGPNQTQIVTTHDGSTFVGRITEVTEEEIVFQTDVGDLRIAISKIRAVQEVPTSSMRGGSYWFPNPNATRLFFAPTAHMLGKGEGYFSDIYLFFPGFAYGLSDNVTIGGGVSLIPAIGIDHQIFYLTPKVGIKTWENLRLALGALLVKLPDFNGQPIVGIAYGTATTGSRDSGFTGGMGYGFVDGDFADKPMVMLGGQLRMTRRTSFVTENYIFPGLDDALVTYGLRFFGEKLSVDLAMIDLVGENFFFPGIPYIDFVFVF